ncbi:MAG: hypothetical protein ACK4ND_01910 [Cytophagaceae bacterium]
MRRITTEWNEFTISRANSPQVTEVNQIITPTLAVEEDLSLDVKSLIQDMIIDPQNSFGFAFINDVTYVGHLIFALQFTQSFHNKHFVTTNSLKNRYYIELTT